MGRGFVRIKWGICQRLFTQLDSSPALPPRETETFSKHQKNKPGILAPRRRPPNSVQITILTLRGSERKSATLWFAIKIKIENCVSRGKHVICESRVEPLWCPIWPVIEQHASSLKRNNNSCLSRVRWGREELHGPAQDGANHKDIFCIIL